MGENYFIKVYKENKPMKILCFNSVESAFKFIESNQDLKFSIYKAKCVCDLS